MNKVADINSEVLDSGEGLDPFFWEDGDHFVPSRAAYGGWGANSLNGKVIVGLLGHEIEHRHGEDGMRATRLTVDLFKLARAVPGRVETRIIRDGRRIRVVEADYIIDDQITARATCQFLRTSENAPGEIWSSPNWNVPCPQDVPVDTRSQTKRLWDMRSIGGEFRKSYGQRKVWVSELRDIVAGREMTPFSRAAATADFASPLSNFSEHGLGYINSDVTLYLNRLPVGPWIGMEVSHHHAFDGISVSECRMYDEDGPIGLSAVSALAQLGKRDLPSGKK